MLRLPITVTHKGKQYIMRARPDSSIDAGMPWITQRQENRMRDMLGVQPYRPVDDISRNFLVRDHNGYSVGYYCKD